jgi:antirestriction protein
MDGKKWYLYTTNKLKRSKLPAKLIFVASGILATLWFLFRVLPKPSRAAYPCMQAVAPVMSGFILYILGLIASVIAFKKAKAQFIRTKYFLALLLTFAGVIAIVISNTGNYQPVYAENTTNLVSNNPVGLARGIFPGRVVWCWDPGSTNENCTNAFGDAWDLPQNTNLDVVEEMMLKSLKNLSGKESTIEIWDALFHHFNNSHGKGDVNYAEGEKIFIKMNFVGGHRSRLNDDHSRKSHTRYGNSQASPQIALILLRQLINKYGVDQENIYIGDPSKNIYKNAWDMWTAEFPNVNYIAELGEMGRIKAVAGENPAVFYSDKGSILDSSEDYLCSALEEADYLINVSALKGHARAGVTLCAKNHYGSHMKDNASHLHPGLPGYDQSTLGFGKYRTLVDFMGHKKLGENTILFLIDGLWSGPDANLQPVKWKSAPFNNDWTSSILVSQDQVALESVCFDFLRTEYTVENSEYPYPQMEGTNDYLLQAADSTYWPEGITYDPENDGVPISSLGVHESWDNAENKQYSRNLGTGDGIELVKLFYNSIPTSTNDLLSLEGDEILVYPNPCRNFCNLNIKANYKGKINTTIFDIEGKKMMEFNWMKESQTGTVKMDFNRLETGTYILNVDVGHRLLRQKINIIK